MVYGYSELIERANRWAQEAHEAGWLTEHDITPLRELDDRSPASLFASKEQRPLVVAFLGGTGVGKSTLLNRLAGSEIARTGVLRPTSREVTIFLHHSLHISQLPEQFPVDSVRMAHHMDDDRKEIMWVDMPDIDSTERKNHEIVFEWLPHIDVLVYVVSPERYRDDRGWRLLLSQGHRHAWLFVLNQWDRGQESQFEDFNVQIAKAGFEDPIILRTACPLDAGETVEDDFEMLNETIQQLAQTHAINQLELRGMRMRLAELRGVLRGCLVRFGTEETLNSLTTRWQRIWSDTISTIDKGLEWPIQQIAKTFVTREASLLGKVRLKTDDSDENAVSKGNPVLGLWDDWAQTRLDDALDQVVIEADAADIPAGPFKAAIVAVRKDAKKTILFHAAQALRQSLANPGNAAQRFFLKLAGVSSTLLPLAAIGWVAYLVFDSYYTSSQTGQPFLGVDFAIHSSLLIAVSWLFPYFIYRRLRPSTEKAAIRGLRTGLRQGYGAIEVSVVDSIRKTGDVRHRLLDAGTELVAACELPPGVEDRVDNRLLSRMLLNGRVDAASSAQSVEN